MRFRKNFGSKDVKIVEKEVRRTINKGLKVKKYYINQKDAAKDIDLTYAPKDRRVRIVEIENFDKQTCRYPHVNSTKEIGIFKIIRFDKNNRICKFQFDVE